MTDEQIKRLRELSDKATPGPWEAKEPAFAPGIGKAAVFGPKANGTHEGRQCIALADAAFISAARNALPELLDDVDRLEAENAALRARCERLEKVREAAEKVDARIGHFHDAPSNDGMPMLSLIVFAAGALRSALAAALEGE